MDWHRYLVLSLIVTIGNGLRMMELLVPQHVARGQNIKLDCNYELDKVKLYSVKWYKDGNEFYRYVPREKPPVLVFPLPGVTVDIHNSTEKSVVLNSVNLMSSGRYRCEVSAEAPSFLTVSEHSDMSVVALPEEGPIITGRSGSKRYQVSDVVRFNCTSAKSKPPAQLSWFINGFPVDQALLRGPYITDVDREGLETVVLGINFRIHQKHFKLGDMKIKCLATIANVYWKSNELSIESDRKVPKLEGRETRPQGHTHAEHILDEYAEESQVMEASYYNTLRGTQQANGAKPKNFASAVMIIINFSLLLLKILYSM